MDDEDNNNDASAPQQPTDTAPDTAGERTFTAAEVEHMVTTRLERDRRARAERPSQPKQAQQPAPARESKADQRIAVLESQLAFRDAISESDVKLNATQRKVLQREFIAERPENAAEWARQTIADLGIGTAPAQPQTQSEPPATPPANQPGPPPPSNQFHEDTPLWRLSDTDRAALVQKIGNHRYRDKLKEQMRGVRVKIRD